MSERSVQHGTFVIERSFPAPVARVYEAFSDPAKKRLWFSDHGEQSEDLGMDFRVGGTERKRFTNPHGVFTNNTVYLDLVPGKRIVFAYTMSRGETCFSSSQATVEFLPAGGGTRLIFTEQGAYFEGADGAQMREGGWRELLGRLERELAR